MLSEGLIQAAKKMLQQKRSGVQLLLTKPGENNTELISLVVMG